MPSIHFDIEDYIDDIDTDDLIAELEKRGNQSPNGASLYTVINHLLLCGQEVAAVLYVLECCPREEVSPQLTALKSKLMTKKEF